LRCLVGNGQHRGRRKRQEDSFAFSDPCDEAFVARAGFISVLADGMGGMARGREASSLAVETILEAYAVKSEAETVPAALKRAFIRANEVVFELGREVGLPGAVGTTALAAVFFEKKLFWAWAGDSRLYLWRRGSLHRLTEDHNLATRLEGEGVSPEAIARNPEREALTSFFGFPAIPHLGLSEVPLPLEEDDRILLCSDGLYRSLDEPEIAALLADDPRRAGEILVDRVLAKKRPRQDNVTALVVAVEPCPAFSAGLFSTLAAGARRLLTS
jgi:protein phosphatase